MKIKPLFILLTFAAMLSIIAISCNDQKISKASQWRLKSLTRVLPDNPQTRYISIFSYTDDGKIASLNSYQEPDSAISKKEQSIYQYDDSDRIIQMARTLSPSISERYTYTYNSSGHLSMIKYTGAPNDFYDMTFTYDNSGKLSSSKRSFNFSYAVSFEQLNGYTFNQENLSNVVTTTTVIRTVPLTSTTTTDFIYDDKPNPFFGNYLIPAPVKTASPTTGNFAHYTYYGGIDNFLHLSKNNLVSSTIQGFSQTSYNYTYHVSGMPESRLTFVKAMPNTPAVLQETLYYEYEQH